MRGASRPRNVETYAPALALKPSATEHTGLPAAATDDGGTAVALAPGGYRLRTTERSRDNSRVGGAQHPAGPNKVRGPQAANGRKAPMAEA